MRRIDLTAASAASAGNGGSIEVGATLAVAPSAGNLPSGSIFGGAS